MPTQRLVLDLSHADGELRATLTHSGPALSPLRTWAARAIDIARLRQLYRAVTAVLNLANAWGDMDQGSRALLRQRGSLLFDEVLPASVKKVLRDAGGGELTLVIDESLVFVPWELMHTGRAFIGLEWAVGRVVRTRQAVVGEARSRPDGPWRMLVLCDPRGDLMSSYYEGVTLRDELDVARDKLAIDLRSSEVGVCAVKQVIRDYDLIHYAGHAELHADAPHRSGWLLSDGVLSPSDLLDLAGGRAFPRLVFSNACRSGRVDGPLVATGSGEAIFSVANAFLVSGVNHYVGTLWDIPDEPACHFSLAFYEALAEGQRLGAAMRTSRQALLERYGHDTVLWASYVLYGDPSVRCFAVQQRPATPAPTSAGPLKIQRPGDGARRPRRAATRVRGGARAMAAPDLVAAGQAGAVGRAISWLTLSAAAAVALTAWGLSGSEGGDATLRAGPYVSEPNIVETFPAPRDRGPDFRWGAAREAPAAVAPTARARGPEFIVVAQRADTAGEFAEERLEEGATLHSWDNFQLRFRLSEPGHVAVWHVESQGSLVRVHPAAADSRYVDHVGWVELPGAEGWYFLDEGAGRERFLLGFSEGSGPDQATLQADAAPLVARLEATRRSRTNGEPGLKLRGLGGTRRAPHEGAQDSEDGLLDSLLEVFESHYDTVRIVEFRHK